MEIYKVQAKKQKILKKLNKNFKIKNKVNEILKLPGLAQQQNGDNRRQKTSKHKDRSIVIIQSEQQRENRLKIAKDPQ